MLVWAFKFIIIIIITVRQLTQHLETNGITYAHYNSHADPADHHEKKEEPELVDT
jgi:hypothetical protein